MLKISTAIKYHILFRSIFLFCGKKMKLISNTTASECLRGLKLKYLTKKHHNVLKEYIPHEEKHEYSKVMWSCWLQGLDSAPDIVKRCYKSINEHKGDFQFILLTDENFKEYVDIPKFVLEKYKKGIISKANFSDVLRAYLMVQKGGIWIDSTCLMTKNVADYVFEKNVFFFNHDYCNEPSLTFNSSWFIFSVKGSNIFTLATKIMEEHLKKGYKWDDYFLFHLFVKMTQNALPSYWDNILFRTDITPHILQLNLENKYSKELYDDLTSQIFIHKLTHKFLDDAKTNQSSIYNYILKN